MLWRTLNYASQPLDMLTNVAMAGGTHGVMQIASSRPQNQVSQPTSNDQDHRQHQQ
jgi:PTS system ascorbate-specific IIA component